MKLIYSVTSPYSRKVRVTIFEKKLENHVEMIIHNPFDDTKDISNINPLGQVPILILADGMYLYDSPVICDYLDSLNVNSKLIPSSGQERWFVLQTQALIDGILDAAFLTVMERRRSDNKISEYWLIRWEKRINKSLYLLETEILNFSNEVNLSHISLGCALGYLDFRLPNIGWRNNHPNLNEWYDEFSVRQSMLKTSFLSSA